MRLFPRAGRQGPPQETQDITNQARIDVEKNLRDTSRTEDASLAMPEQIPIDPELERQVRRKLDRNILPLVFALYLLAFLDRSNIGNARIAGMDKALGLTSDKYTWLLTIFYISYILFQFQICKCLHRIRLILDSLIKLADFLQWHGNGSLLIDGRHGRCSAGTWTFILFPSFLSPRFARLFL